MKNHAMMTAVILAAITPAVLWVFGARAGDAQPLEVVDRVELDRYLGKWYSVASIPQFFDKDCAGGTTADYSLLDNGEISVVNACYLADGSRSEAKGRAWVADESTNARLKVSFIPIPLIRRLFAGDYWIIELGENYEYSVVGHPSRKYGWVLSRTPEMPDDVLEGIMERLAERGYDTSSFKKVNHSDYPG